MHDYKVKVSGDAAKSSFESSVSVHLCKSKVLLANTKDEIRFFDDSQYTEYKHLALNLSKEKARGCDTPHCKVEDGIIKPKYTLEIMAL